MTLNKTESLRLHSNNDISSQSQVNIMPKRKRDRISDPVKNKQSLPTCIIRVMSLSDHGRFTTRSQVSDTLQHICEIRDIRFRQSIDSPYCMQSHGCVQIPTTLLAYLENTGYHRQGYLRYTGNLIRLEDGTKLLPPTPRRRHSIPKSCSARSNLTIFEPDGILCEKIETKCGDL